MLKYIETKLIETFKDKGVFTREELLEFYKKYDPNLKEGTFGWRIYDLKKKNLIIIVQRGKYRIGHIPVYSPLISEELLKLANSINEQFEDVKYCIWDAQWLNEFSKHQSSKKMIVIEIEKEFVDTLFYRLKDEFEFEFYLKPDKKAIEYYVSESEWPVIIKSLFSKSPTTNQVIKNIVCHTPQIEKILVDVFTEKKLFYYYQGAELMHVFSNILNTYPINYTTLFSYAKRRNRETEIKRYIVDNIHLIAKPELRW